MPQKSLSRAKKDYFQACLLAISTGLLSLAAQNEGASNGLVLLGVFAVLMVFSTYLSHRQSQDGRTEKRTEKDYSPGEPRLLRMALLWYVLSLVLVSGLLREPARFIWQGKGGNITSVQWLIGTAGVAIFGFTLFRLYSTLKQYSRVQKDDY